MYGITKDYKMCHENKIKTLLPISTIKYALDKKMTLNYIQFHQELNEFTISMLSDSVLNLNTNMKTECSISDGVCVHFPQYDVVIDKKGYECKLCVYPCHNKSKLFEMIIRQNNIACCIQNIIHHNPNIQHISDDFQQQPYIMLNLYNENGLKPIIFSDKALIYMCLKSSTDTKSQRSKIVCEKIHSMIEEYSKTGRVTYKSLKTDTVPHQKLTLYPIDYIPSLKETIESLEYIKYMDIVYKDVCKTRNICDFIHDTLTENKIHELKKKITVLELELQQKSKILV